MKYKITDDCVSCGTCLVQCKVNAIVFGDSHYEITDSCVGCGDCVIGCPNTAIVKVQQPVGSIRVGNKPINGLYVGGQRVRAVYAGAEKVWPNIVRVEQGEEYGEWTYDDPVRRRTVTPWEQDVYCDDTLGDRRIGTPYTQEETAETVFFNWGVYGWEECSSDHYLIDYEKVEYRYDYSDVTRWSGVFKGEARYRRIDGQCGWVRSTVVVTDWANTGALCNAAGTVGGYDCDGTYRVQYNQQMRTLEDRYPDGSGGINRRSEYRVGSIASRQQVPGYCGLASNVNIEVKFTGGRSQFVNKYFGRIDHEDSTFDDFEYNGNSSVTLDIPNTSIIESSIYLYNRSMTGSTYVEVTQNDVVIWTGGVGMGIINTVALESIYGEDGDQVVTISVHVK